MLLVYEQKDKPGKWGVAWAWLPYFLASDPELIKFVDKEMSTRFGGQEVKTYADLHEMHTQVVDLICKRYPIPNLRKYLGSITWVKQAT